MKIDARLIAVYNEYLEKGKEKEFVEMLYALLDICTEDVVDEVKKARRYTKSKETRIKNKFFQEQYDAYLEKMTPEELIEFLNTPWEDMPEWIKEGCPKMVKYPEEFNFLRIAGEVEKDERQKEIFGSRLVRYMEKYGMITSDEQGTHLHYKRFSEICNELATKYDLARRPGHKAQRVRITPMDLKGYTSIRTTPKKDKLVTIAMATGMPVSYLGGYRDDEPPTIGTDPINPGPFSGKFRKRRMKNGDAA